MHGFVLVSLLVLLRQLLVYTGSVLHISAHHPRCLDTNSIEIIHHSNHGRHLHMPVCVSL